MFTLIFALAVTVGLNTAISGAIYSILFAPLPYPKGDQLAVLHEQTKSGAMESVSYPNYLDWLAVQRSFADIALLRERNVNFSAGPSSEPEVVNTLESSANLLTILGINPQSGRKFLEEEDKPGSPRVLMIGDRLWRDRFGRDATVIGKRITLDNVSYEVVGVLPPEFSLGGHAQLLTTLGSLRADPQVLQRGNRPGFTGLGRLNRGVSLQEASKEFRTIASNLASSYTSNVDRQITIEDLRTDEVGDMRLPLYTAQCIVACVLLIACANVICLVSIRNLDLERDLSIRIALGAPRRHLIEIVAVEHFTLVFVAGVAGVLMALWLSPLISSLLSLDSLYTKQNGVNAFMLATSLVLTAGVGLLTGMLPSLKMASDLAAAPVLGEHSQKLSETKQHKRRTSMLVIAQVATAVAVLTAAILFYKSYRLLQRIELGFDPDGILLATLALPKTFSENGLTSSEFHRQLLERVGSLPEVDSVALGDNIPFDNNTNTSTFLVTGRARPRPGAEPQAEVSVVSSDYFKVLHIPLVRGRTFGSQESLGSPPSIIIDEGLAKRYFSTLDVVGQHIDNFRPSRQAPNQPMTIVGVVKTTFNGDLSSASRTAQLPQIYLCDSQFPEQVQTIVVRTSASQPLNLLSPIKRQLAIIDPNQPISNTTTLHASIDRDLDTPHSILLLTASSAIVALLLALFGIYSVLTLRVTQRYHELGIRLALGSPRASVFWLLFREGVQMVAQGIALGLLIFFALNKVMNTMIPYLASVDFMEVGIAIGASATVASLAIFFPAFRASNTNPIILLGKH